jgi:hypothetical protein
VFDLAVETTSGGSLTRVHGHGSENDGVQGVPMAGGYDVDADGFRDVAIAFMRADPLGRAGAGEVDLILGAGVIGETIDSGIDQARVLRIYGDEDSGLPNSSVGEATGSEIWMDDVTGDGLGDLLICRQNYSPAPGRRGAGALTVLVGGPEVGTFADTVQPLDLRNPDPSLTLAQFVGVDQGDRVGIWARTGDIDGDTIADIVLGADQVDGSGELNRGALYVIRGGSHLAASQEIDLTSFGTSPLADHIALVHPPAGSTNFHLGATCFVADLDGNGRAEILAAATINRAGAQIQPVGANTANASGGAPDGRMYIVWDENFPSGAWPASFEFAIDTASGEVTTISGAASNVSFGEELLGGEDYDGDGRLDLFVGDLIGNGAAGVAQVIYHAEDLRGLTFAVDAPPPGIEITTILGPGPGALGADTATHGDYDNDGISDLAFGNPHDSPQGRTSAGSMHVLYGNVSRWPSLIDLSVATLPDPGVMRIARIDGADGTSGTDGGDTLCYSAATGDIDGDGHDDIIVNEMLGDGVPPEPTDVGNLLIISGAGLLQPFMLPARGWEIYR